VPGLGYITLKVRTSSIHEAVFDKRSNVLKIRGMVEGPMDKLDRYYDFLSHPGTRLPGAAPAQYTTPSTPSLACCCAGSPKAYLCLTFNNMNNLAEVLKAIPRLKARTTFQTASSPAGATPQAPEQAARPAPPELREPPLLPGTMSELPRAAALLRAAALQRRIAAARGGQQAASVSWREEKYIQPNARPASAPQPRRAPDHPLTSAAPPPPVAKDAHVFFLKQDQPT